MAVISSQPPRAEAKFVGLTHHIPPRWRTWADDGAGADAGVDARADGVDAVDRCPRAGAALYSTPMERNRLGIECIAGREAAGPELAVRCHWCHCWRRCPGCRQRRCCLTRC